MEVGLLPGSHLGYIRTLLATLETEARVSTAHAAAAGQGPILLMLRWPAGLLVLPGLLSGLATDLEPGLRSPMAFAEVAQGHASLQMPEDGEPSRCLVGALGMEPMMTFGDG